MRSPAVDLPAERYFADTAAKMNPCRTFMPRYNLCVVLVLVFAHGPSPVKGLPEVCHASGLLKESKIKKCSAYYFDSELLHPVGFQLDIQLLEIWIRVIFT